MKKIATFSSKYFADKFVKTIPQSVLFLFQELMGGERVLYTEYVGNKKNKKMIEIWGSRE